MFKYGIRFARNNSANIAAPNTMVGQYSAAHKAKIVELRSQGLNIRKTWRKMNEIFPERLFAFTTISTTPFSNMQKRSQRALLWVQSHTCRRFSVLSSPRKARGRNTEVLTDLFQRTKNDMKKICCVTFLVGTRCARSNTHQNI